MIIVGLGKARHDSSICLSENGKLKYAKYERESGIKQGRAPEQWYWNKLHQWGISNIDMLVQTDETDFQLSRRLPQHGESHLEINTNHYILDHHFAHLWSNFEFTKYSQGVVIDGLGSGGHTSLIYKDGLFGRRKDLTPAGFYHFLSQHMGLNASPVGNAAGKLMGLMAYGKFNNLIYEKFKNYSLEDLLKECQDSFTNNKKDFKDLICTVNKILFNYILNAFSYVDKSKPVVYSGGAALNVDWNTELKKEGYELIIEPAVYDGGLSIGCIRFAHDFLNLEQPIFNNYPYVQDDECPKNKPSNFTIETIAKELSSGKIVGWYQGHGELGPRALGNRSILMDPRRKDGQKYLNEKVKYREWWRPYGASFLEGEAEYSPYMLYSYELKKDYPSIKHIDNTCRHQTVNQKQNYYYFLLLKEFYKLTGVPCLLNTSLNTKGKPIVSTIDEAKNMLNNTNIDCICIGDNIYYK